MEDPRHLDFYERLGLGQDASAEEIRAAHRALRKEFHPDSRPQAYRPHFDRMMAGINEARDTLLDPDRRARYDRRLAEERLDARRRAQDGSHEQAQERARREAREEERRRENARHEEEARRRREREEARRRDEAERQRAEEERQRRDARDAPGSGTPPGRRTEPTPERQSSPAAPARDASSTDADAPTRLPAPVHFAAGSVLSGFAWSLVLAALTRGIDPIPLVLAAVALPLLAGVAAVVARYYSRERTAVVLGCIAAGPPVAFLLTMLPGLLVYLAILGAGAWAVLLVASRFRALTRR